MTEPHDIELDLSGLAGGIGAEHDDDAPTMEELQETAKDRIWLAGEMQPADDIAYSLHRIDAVLEEVADVLDRVATAQERIATALEAALSAFAGAAPGAQG